MPSDIRKATIERCLFEQNEQRTSAFYANRNREQASLHWGSNYLVRAIQDQRDAAYHYREMWMRLERLIGVA